MKLTPACCGAHTHSTCCDGRDTLEDMMAAELARAAGFTRSHSDAFRSDGR